MESMDEVVGFLSECTPFYVATVDGDTPRVRPFGFVMNYEGKLIFACNDRMQVYQQLKSNPKFEISATNKAYQSVRINGKAEFITNRETKEAVVGRAPSLKNLSSEIDGIVIFYASEAEATFWSMKGELRTVQL